jgi:EpsI family protein
MIKLAVAVLFLGFNYYIYYFLATTETTPPRESFAAFPTTLGEWRCPKREQVPADVERNLGVTDYLLCVFEPAAGDPVGLYVGYHASQVRKEGGGSRETMIHPPAHCLPGSGWDIIDSRKVPLEAPGLPEHGALVNRLIVANGSARQLVYYWYQERGRVIARDWEKVIDLFWDRALRSRTDGALVRFTVPIPVNGTPEASEDHLLELAGRVVPLLPTYVPN